MTRDVPCSQCLKNRLKRLKQCSRYSWDWRKGKEEDTNSHNKNWRYVTGLHLRSTRLFSFLDNNAAKSWDCQADRKLNVAFISPAFPFYSPASLALRFLLSEHLLHWALFCPSPKLPLLSKCGFNQDWVKSCAFFFLFCDYTSLLPFPNLHVWETAGGGSLEVLLVYRCPAKQWGGGERKGSGDSMSSFPFPHVAGLPKETPSTTTFSQAPLSYSAAIVSMWWLFLS